jgi:SAM-dependent methyltransferase
MDSRAHTFGRLGDTPWRDYALKLRLFNALAEPELRAAITTLRLQPGMRVLDAGCGTGETLGWLAGAVAPDGFAVGVDLSANHLRMARAALSHNVVLVQADLQRSPLAAASFDLVWSVNTINHLRDPLQGVEGFAALLRRGGRVALGQSSFLPDMYFAWDSRLERLTNEAVRQYYRDRYGIDERELGTIRSLVGWLRQAGLRNVSPRTLMIERVAPLGPADEAYLLGAIFRQTWGERLQPYLSRGDYEALTRLCDPLHPQFALRRPDFHFLQTLTLVVAQTP